MSRFNLKRHTGRNPRQRLHGVSDYLFFKVHIDEMVKDGFDISMYETTDDGKYVWVPAVVAEFTKPEIGVFHGVEQARTVYEVHWYDQLEEEEDR
jgi:hypothetical protein